MIKNRLAKVTTNHKAAQRMGLSCLIIGSFAVAASLAIIKVFTTLNIHWKMLVVSTVTTTVTQIVTNVCVSKRNRFLP